LALFWLALGFLQQGEELRNSSEALTAQTKELKHTQEQHKALVKSAQEAYLQNKKTIETGHRIEYSNALHIQKINFRKARRIMLTAENRLLENHLKK